MSTNRILELAVSTLVIIVAATLAKMSANITSLALLVLIAGFVVFTFFWRTIESGIFSDTSSQNSNLDELQEHKLLLESIHHLPMPYALYDDQDRLVVWNEHYQDIYANAFTKISSMDDAKHLSYAQMLRLNSDGDLSGSELDDYIDKRVKAQRSPVGNIIDRCYPKHGWYRVSKFTTPSGGVAGFAIDINELKDRESELIQEIEHRKRLEKEVRQIANTDLLTGISNRRHFMEMAEREFEQAKTSNELFSVLMLDIDFFKNINDSYGHSCGDDVISTVAKITANILNTNTSRVGRMGGEEFAAFVPGLSAKKAYDLANLIRETIENLTFFADGKRFTTTASIGVAEMWASDANVTMPIQRADQALYLAKGQGRNCTRIYDQAAGNQLDQTG